MNLSKLIESLEQNKTHEHTYKVPSQWTDNEDGYKNVNPSEYILDVIEKIAGKPTASVNKHKNWTKDAIIYNLFIRSACAVDHDNDGVIGGSADDPTLNSEGMRETGTFIKAIAMLEYIKKLGCNTVYLLPITTIGMASRKGVLGSPYAIKNPFELDKNLADPLTPNLTVDEQFSAFTKLAHHLGLRVVLEFVFRTSSLDGDWVKEHPEWYYWIKDEIGDRSPKCPDGYGNPTFSHESLLEIKTAGEKGDSGLVRTPDEIATALKRGEGKLIEPPSDFQNIFTDIPATVEKTDAKWTGILSSGNKVRIPGAFADWPPDDVQPPWTDVTYLRMYGKALEQFNYIAYNTIRLYDPNLATEEKKNNELWDTIASIIPSYQERFNIDGVMVDMGHALPVELASLIQKEARKNDENFAFWEEKFFLDPVSPKTGYEAVVGPGIFVLNDFNSCRQYLFDLKSTPCRFFATGENHNTPRLGKKASESWAKAAWTIATFLPGSIPFIHNGMELNEKMPLNTGLGFSEEEMNELKETPLGLFDQAGFDWGSKDTLIDWVSKVTIIRQNFKDVVSPAEPETFEIMTGMPEDTLGFYRKKDGKPVLAVLVNNSKHKSTIQMPGNWECLIKTRKFSDEITMRGKKVIVVAAV